MVAISLFALPFLVTAVVGSVIYKGFVNDPLGQASLAVDGSGHLIVSNIGSSGQDGVRVAFGSQPFEWELALPAAASGPDGAYVDLTSVGMVDGVLGQEILSLRVIDVGNLYELRVDTSALQSGSLSVSTQHQDLVPDVTDHSPPPSPSHAVARFAAGDLRIGSALVGAVTVFQTLRFDTPTVVELPASGFGPHVASSINLATVSGLHIAGFTDTFELRAAGIDPVVIEDEDTLPDCLQISSYCTAKTSSAGCVASMASDPELSCTTGLGCERLQLANPRRPRLQERHSILQLPGRRGPSVLRWHAVHDTAARTQSDHERWRHEPARLRRIVRVDHQRRRPLGCRPRPIGLGPVVDPRPAKRPRDTRNGALERNPVPLQLTERALPSSSSPW